MIKIFSIAILLVTIQTYGQSNLKIKFQPSNSIYLYQVNAGNPKEIYNAVIQNIAIVNNSEETFDLENVRISVFKDSLEIQTINIYETKLNDYASRMSSLQEQGLLDILDFQFQTSLYLENVSFPSTTRIEKNEAIILSRLPLLFDNIPDSIIVTATAYDLNYEVIFASNKLEVVNYISQNKYNFPLQGTWSAFGAPSLNSHHRWTSIQEFAYDFIKIDSKGNSHVKNGSKLKHFYAYNQPVFSIGEGKVVSVYNKSPESNSNLKQPNETQEEHSNKARENQNKLLKQGFEFILGNHVIIEHPNGEYSYYMHLKPESIKVKIGEGVSRAQHIASLGHSGNSSEPHLHFQLSDSSNILKARGLPIVFQNIGDNEWSILYGEIIKTEKEKTVGNNVYKK